MLHRDRRAAPVELVMYVGRYSYCTRSYIDNVGTRGYMRRCALSLALTFIAPPLCDGVPLRRLSQPLPPLPPLPASISRLYAYGGTKKLRECTLDGIRYTDLVCWDHVKLRPCDCHGTKAHLFAGACGKHLSFALGCAPDGCPGCAKSHPEAVSDSLTAWYSDRFGVPVVAEVAPLGLAHNASTRSASTAASGDGAAARCTVPPSQVLERLRRHATSSKHVSLLLEESFLDDMLAQPASRRLLTQRGSLKEISEAYAAAAEVRRLGASLGLPASTTGTGRGLTLLDVCSGKGVGAHLLSRLLPESQVVMLDLNAKMDLSHVCMRPNLRFVEFDLFSAEAGAALHSLGQPRRSSDARSIGSKSRSSSANGAVADPLGSGSSARAVDDHSARSWCIAIGMHLCGALSPRLLALACHVDAIDAFAVCPCCIKGSLGDHVKRSARASGLPNYEVLLLTLRAFCESELGARGQVWMDHDEDMLSPRDGLISAVKAQRHVLW